MPDSFALRFERMANEHSGFCFGVDPSPQVLKDWSLPVSLKGLAEFVSIALEAAESSVGIIKPQIAFYEAFASAGLVELERLIQGAKDRKLMVIADAKRGDIGNSVSAYARAWLGHEGFDVDAVTVNAYLGFGTLKPVFEEARNNGKAAIVVVRSSNPEGAALQSADMNGTAVADQMALSIRDENAKLLPDNNVGPIAAVVGATLGPDARQTIDTLTNALFLVPGIGAQGATVEDVKELFRNNARRVIASSSRAALSAGPDVAALKSRLAQYVGQSMKLREP